MLPGTFLDLSWRICPVILFDIRSFDCTQGINTQYEFAIDFLSVLFCCEFLTHITFGLIRWLTLEISEQDISLYRLISLVVGILVHLSKLIHFGYVMYYCLFCL